MLIVMVGFFKDKTVGAAAHTRQGDDRPGPAVVRLS